MYATDQDTKSFWVSHIDRLDLATGESTRLTHGGDYNEHPTVVSTPSGDWVIHMSTHLAQRRPLRVTLGADWWAMRADGSGAKRLTTMNVRGPGNAEDSPQVAGAVSVSLTGQFMLGDVQDNLAKQTGLVRIVHFVCP
jgi:Tol biopolymer transport system component